MSETIADREFAERAAEQERAAQRRKEALAKAVSPPGAFGLPELLEARRLECSLPDAMFSSHCVYDRILVAQIAEENRDTFTRGGMLIKPEKTKAREMEQAPRGIIVTAGLLALDHLRSNGMDLGHIVRFVRNSVYRIVVDNVEGTDVELMVLRSGDIVSSEDLELLRRECEFRLHVDETGQHCWLDTGTGEYLKKPKKPFIPADY